MAGAGFRTFVDGEVLTAAQVNTYLMQQAVMVFADASARSTAIAAPSEGMVTYLTGTDALEYYDGSSWVGINDADAIQNSIVDAKGDLIVATADNTPSRLAVGTNGHVLTADSAETAGVKWAAIAASGKVLQVVTTFKDDTFSTASTSFTDVTGLTVSITPSSATSKILIHWYCPMTGAWGASNGRMQVTRGGTAIAIGATASSRTRVTADIYPSVQSTYIPVGGHYLDSPATTSATTYAIQVSTGGSGTMYVNRSDSDTDNSGFSRSAASITVMEIGA